MSLSSAKNYALRAAKSQDQKEATELLSKAIMELTLAIEATDARIKKMNKVFPTSEDTTMSGISEIKEHMEVIGADGVHVGTVDHVEGNRIKLTKADSGEGHHKGHHHFIDGGLVAE
eukprot:gene12472-16624_t